MKWVAVCLLWLGGTVPALSCMEHASPLEPQVSGPTEIFARLDPIKVSKPFGLELAVCPAGGDISGQLAVDASMPKHKHGMNYTPSVQPLGKGRFAVANMVFHMPGQWRLRVTHSSGGKNTIHLLDLEVK